MRRHRVTRVQLADRRSSRPSSQELCILLSPALFAATIYMTYGRLITYVGPKYSIIRPSRVTAFFVFVRWDSSLPTLAQTVG